MFDKIKQLFTKREDENEKKLSNLQAIFINNPDEGIEQAKIYLMSPKFTNFDEYMEDIKKTQKSNCCITSWTKTTLSARCLDCQKQENSCICIPCYLAGKHDQHHSYLLGGSGSGNCDCGDPNFWKPEGNCPNHPGPDPNPEITQMTPENRDKFINIFSIAYKSALTVDDDAFTIQILDWISSFISFGDGLRRCVAIGVTKDTESSFIHKLPQLQKEPLNSLLNLFGKLISDQYFSQKMGQFTFKNYLSMRNTIKQGLLKDDFDKKSLPFRPTKKFLNFTFHFFNARSLNYAINEEKFDWITFILKCIKFILETTKQIKLDFRRNSDGQIISQFWFMNKLIEALMQRDDQHDNIQKFINKYSSLISDYEASFYFTFPKMPEDDSENPFSILFLYMCIYQFNVILSPINEEASQKNKTFLLDETFSRLLKFLNSQKNLRAYSIYSDNDVHVSPFLPLHHLFYCLLSSYKNPAEILNGLCQKKKISLQQFCCLSSIYPLRFLTSIFVPERFHMLNSASKRLISYCIDCPNDTFNILFGHVQTMFNIAPDKEEFLSMIIETFGIFDDKHFTADFNRIEDEDDLMTLLMNIEKQNEMHNWSVLNSCIFIVSLITDNSIITFNKVLFKRLCVIELLMNAKPTARDIENWVGDKLSNPIFGDDLQSFAERVKTSNGVFFRLKDEQNEFTPFFPLIIRMNRMKILMKYTDKLVPIPNCTVNPNVVSVFSAPTYIASMYTCLVSKEITFNQVGLAMFVLAARYGRKYDFQNTKQNGETIKLDSISQLIEELRNREKKDENFNPFLLRVELNNNNKDNNDNNNSSNDDGHHPMSIIEAVQSMKKIGIEALEKTDLPDFLRPKMDEDDDQIQKKKKERAANLKQALLKEFQNKRSMFTMGGPSTKSTKGGMNSDAEEEANDNDDDNDDDGDAMDNSHGNEKGDDSAPQNNESSEIMCNICQTKVTDDILGFPCLSLPCILPSLINNKLHNLGVELDNMESVFSMSICLHHVHRKCCKNLIKEDESDYNCMIDRGKRNCFLPLFPDSEDLTTETSEVLTEAVESFMKEAFGDQDGMNNQSLPMKSYAGVVLTIEVRHRSRPECLDNPTVPALLSNMLRTLYKALHGKTSQSSTTEEEDEKDPLVKLVSMMIESDSPRNEFKNFVKKIAVTLKDDGYLYEFLRRAAIIEDFALIGQNNKDSEDGPKFIDWDEILSFDHLIERYEIEGNQIDVSLELPLFETIPLAERFVGLYQPPYNMDIFDISESKFVDLLTGNVVFYSREEQEIPGKPEIPHVLKYTNEKYHGGLAMFLGLTGPNASDIIICCPSIDRLFNLDGFYVDQFGDIDRGFKRGAILALSNDRLENALDKLLSGDVILYN